jgi:phosphatidylglycerophosphate synthase
VSRLRDDVTVQPMNPLRRQTLPASAARQRSTEAAGVPARASASLARAGLRREALRDMSMAALALALLSLAAASTGSVSLFYPVKALLFYAAGAALAWRALGHGAHPQPRFGAANRVTLGRLALAALLAALLGEALPRPPLEASAALPVAWLIVAAATLAALLDAVDGALARRSGLASDFGARFDMETDAAFTLVLSALVLQAGQAGPWVLAAGLMRYAFVAAGLGLALAGGAAAAQPAAPGGVRAADHHADRLPRAHRAARPGRRAGRGQRGGC